jgi:ADP-heptose:LPS heptosyltransferase
MRWNPEGTRPPRKVLFVQWRRIGDAVLVTPALDAAREAWPDAEIHLLVSPPAADLFAGDDRVSALWMRPPGRRLPSLARALRREGFELVLDFQSLGATAFLARCAGGYAIGYAKRGRGLVYHRRVAALAHRGSG